MALVSPGVQVSVIDESFYTPAEPGTTPMIFVVSAQDKKTAAGTSTATGTYNVQQSTDETSTTLQSVDDGTTDKTSSNKQFEIDADSVFDFTESNPFGENP